MTHEVESASVDEHVQLELGVHVLHALEPAQAVRVDAHLEHCADCARDAAALRDVLNLLDILTPDDRRAILGAAEASPPPADPVPAPPTAPTPLSSTAPPSLSSSTAPPSLSSSTAPPSLSSSTAPPSRSGAATGPGGPPGPPARGRRTSSSRGRRRLAVVAVALALVAGLGIGVGIGLSGGEATDIALTGQETNATTGASVSVDIVGTADGSHVKARVGGLHDAQTYRLYVVTANGASRVVATWEGTPPEQTVEGDVPIAARDLVSVTVATAAGAVVVSVRVVPAGSHP